MDREEGTWIRVGEAMPKEVGDIGFPIVVHPRDPDTVWVFPMDGTTVWPRTSPGGRPAAYRTRDAGATWQRQDRGLPSQQAWFTVKRQAFAADGCDPLGLYFGTTSGEIWMSADEGESWRCIVSHLPEVYSVTAAMAPL
ncbi:MAG TPA: glycosyl hydrolase, partial [Candidatus Polarisedimenticolia bacterium]|nr:glycosyl hydrolase [Candidatus Polarisedimenticolia bacterium]